MARLKAMAAAKYFRQLCSKRENSFDLVNITTPMRWPAQVSAASILHRLRVCPPRLIEKPDQRLHQSAGNLTRHLELGALMRAFSRFSGTHREIDLQRDPIRSEFAELATLDVIEPAPAVRHVHSPHRYQ